MALTEPMRLALNDVSQIVDLLLCRNISVLFKLLPDDTSHI